MNEANITMLRDALLAEDAERPDELRGITFDIDTVLETSGGCFTAGCVAGMAAVLAGAPIEAAHESVDACMIARDWLGLDYQRAWRLFMGPDGNAGTGNTKVTSAQAAQALNQMLEGAQWRQEIWQDHPYFAE